MNQKTQTSSIRIISGAIGDYPIRLELIPKRLVVAVYQQNLVGKGSHIPCWIYVTQGMNTFKQKEIALVLRIAKDATGRSFPKAPLQLFLFLFKAVTQKKRFQIGDVLRLGEKGLLGFWGMGFTHELVESRGLDLPKHYLTGILLSQEELVAAQAFGLTRVLARMGYEANRFPIHAWNDLERNSIPMQSIIRLSEFKNIKTLALKHCSVNLVQGEKVVLVLATAMHAGIMRFIKEQGGAVQLGLTTQLLPYHEGALVWLPDKDLIEMNVHPDAEGNLIAGSFLLLRRADTSGASMLEDGFQVEFDQQAWPLFLNALLRKQNITITPNGGGMEFSLAWNTSTNPEIQSGLNQALEDTGSGENHGRARGGWLGKIKHALKRK